MATFPACSISIACIPSPQSGKVKVLNSASLGASKRANLSSSRYSKFHICCQAKPETVDKVIAIVRKTLALAPDSPITPATTFAEDLGADSLDTVEIVMGLEEAFDITVEEDSAQSITNVQEAADVIEKLVEDKAKAAA